MAIERKFVAQNLKEFEIGEFIMENLKKVGYSHTKLQRTPLGEKIIISASRPGLLIGRKGQNIKNLTKTLKKRFGLENPQIEIGEVDSPDLDPQIIAERIANSMERFGSARFKAIGHKVMESVMAAGALGVEILIAGKIPSARAKSWRFYQGYLKKCGNISQTGVRKAYAAANLKSGTVGIQVRIMPPWIKLPDDIGLREEKDVVAGEAAAAEEIAAEEKAEEAQKEEAKAEPEKPKRKPRKKAVKQEKETKETPAENTES
jgi:small subunit ribosomal protein S3